MLFRKTAIVSMSNNKNTLLYVCVQITEETVARRTTTFDRTVPVYSDIKQQYSTK